MTNPALSCHPRLDRGWQLSVNLILRHKHYHNTEMGMGIKLIILMVFTIFLTSCGKSGALYLPQDAAQQKENNNQDAAK